jgi:hypothetical protein
MIYLSSTTDKHPKSIKKFWPLPWDEVEQEEKPISKEQLQRTIQMMKNL